MREVEKMVLVRLLTGKAVGEWPHGVKWTAVSARLSRRGLVQIGRVSRAGWMQGRNTYRLTTKGAMVAMRALDQINRPTQVFRAGPRRGQVKMSRYDAYGKLRLENS